MSYKIEYQMLAGDVRTVVSVQGQEVAIQDIKDLLRGGTALHATMRNAHGVVVWAGVHS